MSQTQIVPDHAVAHMAVENAPPIILLDKVNKWYGALHVLRDVSMAVIAREEKDKDYVPRDTTTPR